MLPLLRLPLARLHIRHAMLLWVGARVVVAMAGLIGGAPPQPLRLAGWDVGLLMIAITVALSEVDIRRTGAPDLLANLGVGTRERIGLAVVAPLIGESLLVAWSLFG